jgi:predicted nucleotide-binding protein
VKTIDWLQERICEGETLLGRLVDLSAGPARRSGDIHSPKIMDVRDFLTEFTTWDSTNLSGLRRAFGNETSWVEQYRSIEKVDRQLATTDFTSHKSMVESCVVSKLDQLRSILDSVVRRVLPRGDAGARVFIGHGRSGVWTKLRHLIEGSLGLEIEEFESEPTVGIQIADRLDEMISRSQFAVIVMTGEDVHSDGTAHARENVIHEIGLCQGVLGRSRVVVLIEEGCQEFSNIKGIVYARFQKDRIESALEVVRGAMAREGLITGRANAA